MTVGMDARPTGPTWNRSLAVRLLLPGLILTIALAGHLVAAEWGRHWILTLAPAHAQTPGNQAVMNWLPLVAGLALALLAFWLLSLSHRTERRAVALAERMTRSLRESKTDLARSNAELIGLAICKRIVESHGGRTWVDSHEGHGARFTFALPAAHDAPLRTRPVAPLAATAS